jgi:hypothetical protein
MANIDRIRVSLFGFIGGPGVMTFYASDAAALLPDLQTFLAALVPGLPSTMNLDVEHTGDTVVDATGVLVGGWSGSALATLTGADTAPYPAPSGACVTWVSDGIPWGYRLKGRTYLVPIGGGSYDTDGTINPTNVANIQAAADAFVTAGAGNFKVWNRPRAARAADGSRPAVIARAGTSFDVVSAVVADRTAVLTSRRD